MAGQKCIILWNKVPFNLGSVPECHRGKDHSMIHQAAQKRDGDVGSPPCYFCSSALVMFGPCIFEKDGFCEPIWHLTGARTVCVSVHTFQTCLYHHCSSFNGVVLPFFPPLPRRLALAQSMLLDHHLAQWQSHGKAEHQPLLKTRGQIQPWCKRWNSPGFKKSVSLDTMICLELVSPSVTKWQSSLFLWVVASTLPAPRNLISALLGLLNPLSQCPMGTWDRIIHFHRNFPKATIPAHHSFSCSVSSFHFRLNFSQIHTPNFICHCCALCFPHFLPPKMLVHSVTVLFCRHLVFPDMFIIS